MIKVHLLTIIQMNSNRTDREGDRRAVFAIFHGVCSQGGDDDSAHSITSTLQPLSAAATLTWISGSGKGGLWRLEESACTAARQSLVWMGAAVGLMLAPKAHLECMLLLSTYFWTQIIIIYANKTIYFATCQTMPCHGSTMTTSTWCMFAQCVH